MAIVPIRDDYTDAPASGVIYTCQTPVVLPNNRTLLVTNRGIAQDGGGGGSSFASFSTAQVNGPQARIYNTETATWLRGDPYVLDIDPTTARACSATLDGNVLLQGTVVAVSGPPAQERTAYATEPLVLGGSSLTLHTGIVWSQEFRYNGADLGVNQITVDVSNFSVQQDFRLHVALCLNDGSDTPLVTPPAQALGNHMTTATFSFPINVFTFVDGTNYKLKVWATGYLGGDEAYLPLADKNAHPLGDYWFGFTTTSVIISGRVLTFGFRYFGQDPGATTLTPKTGYAVLDVNGDDIVALGEPVTLAGTNVDDVGPCTSSPEAMVRIPTTNRFWAWRSYPDHGLQSIDLIQVKGLAPGVLSSAAVTAVGASTPRAIIPISSTEAISVLSLPTKLLLVHASVDNASNVTAFTQEIVGYLPNDGACLVPGLKYHAELLVKASTTDPLKLIRLGVQWNGASFQITSLPITQLDAGLTPPGYTPRTKTAKVSVITGASQIAVGGLHMVARRYEDNGTDDNWILLTEYDQSNGEIIANTWYKGDLNGGKTDQLLLSDLTLRYDATNARAIIGATETYLPAGATNLQVRRPARLGVYRRSYTLDASKRSQREAFER